MTTNHYDAVILGDSLAARVAGALLARSGRKVLTLRESAEPPLCWFLPSRHLDRLLTVLKGESCITSPTPLQVLTGQTRLEVHGATPLEEELRREFPESHEAVLALLEHLEASGERLDQAMLDCGPFLFQGSRGGLRLFRKTLRSGMRPRRLTRPLAELLDIHLAGEPKKALEALFSGVSLVPPERLSVGEAALLWHFLNRNRTTSTTAFTSLLDHRFSQFQGEAGDLKMLRGVDLQKKGPPLVTLANGEQISAEKILIGNPEACRQLGDFPVPLPSSDVTRLVTSELKGATSPLLAGKVVLAGSPPLRCLFRRTNDRLHGTVDCFSTGQTVDPSAVSRRLEQILPFERFTLLPGPTLPETSEEEARRRRGPLTVARNLRPARRGPVYLCHGGTALPALGAAGEIVVGMQVAGYLGES